MSKRPAVSVVMPVFNGERFVRAAVESILRQTWTDFELVCVDDGSTDATAAILIALSFVDRRIRIVTNTTNEGIAKALNRGLAASRGELIARHDADDVAHRSRIETQVAFLRANPAVAMVGAQVRIVDARGRRSNPPGWWRALTHDGIRFQSLFDNPFIHSSVVYRRSIVWDALRGYDESFAYAEDFELWTRIAASYEVRNLPQKLVDFRFRRAAEHPVGRQDSAHTPFAAAVFDRVFRELLPGRTRTRLDVDELLAIYHEYVERHGSNRDIARVMAMKLAQLGAFRKAYAFDKRTALAWAPRMIARYSSS